MWRRFIWLLLLIAFLSGVAGYLAFRFQLGITQNYTSSVDVRVLPSRAELIFARNSLGGNSAEQTTALMRTFMEVTTSDKVVEAALARLSPELKSRLFGNDVSAYRKAIKVSNIGGSFIMRISVSLPDALSSAKLANSLAAAYNTETAFFDSSSIFQIREELKNSLREVETAYEELLLSEIALREEIGALSLEAEVDLDRRALERQSAALSADRIREGSLERRIKALDRLDISTLGNTDAQDSVIATGAPITQGGAQLGDAPPVPSAEPPPAQFTTRDTPLLQEARSQLMLDELAGLEDQIAERERIVSGLRNSIAESTKKQIRLRGITTRQTELQRRSAGLLDAIFSAEMTYRSSNVAAVVLRSAAVASEPDSPSPITAAFAIGAVCFVLAASLVAIPSALAQSGLFGQAQGFESEAEDATGLVATDDPSSTSRTTETYRRSGTSTVRPRRSG